MNGNDTKKKNEKKVEKEGRKDTKEKT